MFGGGDRPSVRRAGKNLVDRRRGVGVKSVFTCSFAVRDTSLGNSEMPGESGRVHNARKE